MLFDYRCRQFGAKAIHEGTTGSFEKFRITWQGLPFISRSLSHSLSHSLPIIYSIKNRLFAVAGSIRGHPSWRCLPVVHQQLKCRCSIYVVLCTALTLSFNSLSLSLPPFLAVLRILMSCLCFVSVSVRLNNRLEFRLPLGEWVLNERFNADNTIFTYDKNQSILRLVARPWKSITLTFRKWLIGENLYSIPSFYGLFTCV